MQKLTNIPSFHDGHFLGVILHSEANVSLFVSDLENKRYEIRLSGVDKLKIDNMREGNIILSIESDQDISLDDPLIDEILEIDNNEMRKMEFYRKYIEKLKNRSLIAFALNPSYGASIVALCNDIAVVQLAQ